MLRALANVGVRTSQEGVDLPHSGGIFSLELDGRLILKDRALKSNDLDLYHEIDKLKPEAVEYLVRK